MADFFETMMRNLIEFYSRLDLQKKISTIIVALLVVTTMVAIIIWAAKTRYEILYTDLNREDSKQIAVLLEKKGVPYQLSGDGKTVMVPEEMIDQWRLELATMGVKFTGTVGYEVFDSQSFGTTSFVQRVNKQRALEGELVRTINYIRGVKRSRVHLNIPESSPFVSEKKPPSASVVVELERGLVLTEKEIAGIGALVSSTIEGMRIENVVILDDRGKKLSDNIGDPMTVYTANRLALESKINRKFEQQIEEILGKVVGDGKVVAKVSVAMDFTESVSTNTIFDNENKAALSEVKNVQKSNGSRPSPQGIPGARSNLPGEKPQPGIPETKQNVDKQLVTTNYNVPSKITKSKNPTAKIKQISAAVMVDGKRVPAVDKAGKPIIGKDGKQVMKYEKWSEGELQNFQAIVASSIGLSLDRGDKIVLKNMEFAQEDLDSVEAMMTARANRELIKNVVKYLAVGIIISLFFFLVARPFIQWITDSTVESVEDFLPKTIEELEKVQVKQKLPGLEEALPQLEEKMNPEKIAGNMLRDKIISLVEGNPSKAAQILHEMIHAAEAGKDVA